MLLDAASDEAHNDGEPVYRFGQSVLQTAVKFCGGQIIQTIADPETVALLSCQHMSCSVMSRHWLQHKNAVMNVRNVCIPFDFKIQGEGLGK